MHALSFSLIVSLTCAHLCLREEMGGRREEEEEEEQWEHETDKDLEEV